MDPRERADAALARARARGSFVVTPESAISPMDAVSTLQIPRTLVSAIDRRDVDPEATMSLAAVEPEDTRPAIAQEAATQSLASPAPPVRRAPEPAPREPMAMSWAPPEVPEPQPEPVEGLVPTVKQPPATRPSLSQRLDG